MTHGSLFSGIGGIDLGFDRAGIETLWQVEQDDYCTRVLEKHWPRVQRFRDVRECGAANLARVDIISGGFPCQPVSLAGKRRGQDDPRWLWPEFARIVRELRPRYVFVENVPGLLHLGMGDVLGDLAACGYDAEWACLDSRDAGIPQARKRIFIVGYSRQQPTPEIFPFRARQRELASSRQADERKGNGLSSPCVATLRASVRRSWPRGCDTLIADSDPGGIGDGDGFPQGLDGVRYRALGNAVVPQVAEWLGRRIVEADGD